MTYVSRVGSRLALVLGLIAIAICASAQTSTTETAATSTVPRLVNFSGKALDEYGKPYAGSVGVTFAIYKDQSEGSPVWMETQNVQLDARSNYSAQLGASSSQGLPLDVFASGEARWLGVRINGGNEQPRVLLLSVPYALKAADAQTLGGLPASAFLLAPATGTNTVTASSTAAQPTNPLATQTVTTAGGTVKALAKFDSATDVASSQIFDNGTNVGIGTSTPTARLEVNGGVLFHGQINLPATGTATATSGKNSHPINMTVSVFDSGQKKALSETFRWQAEPVGNNTGEPTGKLSLLFGRGNSALETGLSIADNGVITFAPGQTFPTSGGNGTVTSVALSAPTSDFAVSGSPITSSGTLGLQWLVPPTSLNVANAIVKRDPTGAIAVDSINATHAINAGSTSDGIAALFGFNASGDTGGLGVFGLSNGFTGVGVFGENMDRGVGVNGLASGTAGQGVVGESSGNANSPNGMGPDGVDGFSHSSLGSGVAAINTSSGDGLFAQSSTGFAAFFVGDVDVDGRLSKAAGSFKIDHPLDPANKYLYHSFVESPDMKNIYDGTVALDASGAAVVHLPNWFSALNRDFRYQLTAIGSPSPNLYVAEEIHGNRFKIAGGKPGAKVSWQVTGTRQDVYANAHRIPVEEAKSEKERGFYLHPELFGAPPEKSIAAARHPMAARVARGERNLTQKSPQVSSAK